jgi:hypothetical protein
MLLFYNIFGISSQGIHPNITINKITIIIPAIIKGIKNLRIASITMTINAIINSGRIGPLYDNNILVNPTSIWNIENGLVII